jgi:O-antigen ligase
MVVLSLAPLRPATPRPDAGSAGATPSPALPAWPVLALFGLYPVWWGLGVLDMILVPLALVMVLYLVRTPGVRAPRGYGLWLFFLVWAGCSVVQLHELGPLIGFTYRYSIYLGATVLFVYLYNARTLLRARPVLGALTVVWLTTVVGGYLGVLWPGGVVETPMAYVVDGVKNLIPAAASLLNNELITHMVVRRFSQFNPSSFFELAPRPSAPFRFTNNWGNVYSVLLPMVVAYAYLTTRTRRLLLLGVALPLSLVPALLTLNRGMLIGIGIAMLYAGTRLLFMGRPKPLAGMAVAVLVGAVLFSALPVQERIENRLANAGSSNETRSSLYQQSLESVPESPIFGHGVPKGGDNPNAPPVGTQGQVWMILVSHGPVALFCALGWLVLAIVQSRRRRDLVGLATHTSLLVGTIELLYYGVLPYGLPLLMVAAALALRPADETKETG